MSKQLEKQDLSDKKPIKFPEKALPTARELLNAKNIAEMQFKTYVQGVFDSLGLNGDWNLDTTSWVINPLPSVKSNDSSKGG